MATRKYSQRLRRVVASAAPRALLLFVITAVLLLLIGMPFANRVTLAGNTVGSFEIDGDLTVEHSVPPAEPIDWYSSPFPAALTTFTDGTGSTDDIFGQGSKENTQSTWSCVTGSAPPKDDILNQISINGVRWRVRSPSASFPSVEYRSSSFTPTGRAFQTTATPISITNSIRQTPRLPLPAPAARNCQRGRPAIS